MPAMQLFNTRPSCGQLQRQARVGGNRPAIISNRRLIATVATATQEQQRTVQISAPATPFRSNGSSNGNGSSVITFDTPATIDMDVADMPGLPHHHTSRRGLVNKVQLSTYGDCIGDNIRDLMGFLERHITDGLGSVHLLPFYPSSADKGFAPITYQEVDPAQGTWEDVEHLMSQYQLLAEMMVNHISPESEQFKDYLAQGDESAYAEMFIRWDRLWGEGRPTPKDLELIRTRKPSPPVLHATMHDGTVVPLWCTFSPMQVDIDPFSEQGWAFLEASLRNLCERGAKMIRLDAFGYVTKKPGTRCFMEEPGVWDILAKIKDVTDPYGTQLLCEVHENYACNIELARRGFWCYDFALPLLMLHAMEYQHATSLRHWLRICPRRQITVLDTHDGMGIDDIKGLAPLVDIEELQNTVEHCLGCNPNFKYVFRPNTDGAHSTSDPAALALGGRYEPQPHQYNCTYYSAVKRNPHAYLLARAIQFFTPGVPMVYYVGMLAGTNDHELAEATGHGRDINRHRYSMEEAEAAVQQPVVQDLLALCRFRNSFPAFQGNFSLDSVHDSYGGGDGGGNHTSDVIDGQGIYPDSEHVLRVGWQQGNYAVQLTADVRERTFEIRYTDEFGVEPEYEVVQQAGNGNGNGNGTVHIEQQEHVGPMVHVEGAIQAAREAAEEMEPFVYSEETSSSNESTMAEDSMDELGQLEEAMAAGRGIVHSAHAHNGNGNGNGNGARRAPQLLAATADTSQWNLLVLPGLIDKTKIFFDEDDELCHPVSE